MDEEIQQEVYNAFACSCGEEFEKQCADRKVWAKEFLDSKKFRKTEDSNLISHIVWYLSTYYDASIDQILNDPGGWSMVIASDKTYKTFIECDYIEDGFVFVLKAFYDKYGDKNESVFAEEYDDD